MSYTYKSIKMYDHESNELLYTFTLEEFAKYEGIHIVSARYRLKKFALHNKETHVWEMYNKYTNRFTGNVARNMNNIAQSNMKAKLIKDRDRIEDIRRYYSSKYYHNISRPLLIEIPGIQISAAHLKWCDEKKLYRIVT